MKNIEILKFMILHKKHLALKMSILDKIDEYVMRWVYYDKIRYLALFHMDEKYENIFDTIRHLIMWTILCCISWIC